MKEEYETENAAINITCNTTYLEPEKEEGYDNDDGDDNAKGIAYSYEQSKPMTTQ